MAIEMEVKFKMERETWEEVCRDLMSAHETERVERQTNQYYNTSDDKLQQLKIGLRLRLLDDHSVLTIKRDTQDAYKRQELEERYDGILETLPPHSPALQGLLEEIGSSYDDLAPLVMMRTERTVFLLEEQGVMAEVCCDDVAIIGRCREHRLYEVEFELLEGSEDRLLQLVNTFKNRYGDRVTESRTSKLAYAVQWVNCSEN